MQTIRQTGRSRKIGSGRLSLIATALIATGTLTAPLCAPQPAAAQTPFQILKPENGSRVRETVKIILLRSALGDAKYMSLSIDGKFRAALEIPNARADGKLVKTDLLVSDNKAVAILWDTKGTNRRTADAVEISKDKPQVIAPPVDDGEHVVEIILHDANGKRIGRRELRLVVSNRAGLSMPSGGVPLTYRFQRGDESKYKQTTSVRYVGEVKEEPRGGTGSGRRGRGYAPPGAGFGTFGGGGFGGDLDGEGGPGFGGPVAGPGGFRGGVGGRGGFSGAPVGGGFGGAPMGGGVGGRGSFGGPPSGFGGPPGGYPGGLGGFGGPGTGYSQPTGPFTIPVQDVLAEYERTVEDYAGPGLFFVRDKVIDGTIIAGNGAAALLKAVYDFKSRYRTVRADGYVRDQGIASAARPGAYVALAIPTLGGGRRRINDTWRTQTPVLLEWATMDKPPYVFAENRLVGLEWQDGYQTARIVQTYRNKVDMPIFGGAATINGANVKMDRVIWFAYNAGKVVRVETAVEVDGNAPASVVSAMVPGAGVGSGFGGGGLGGPGGIGGVGFSGDDYDGVGVPGFGPGGPTRAAPGGFGALTQQQEEVKVPVKLRSFTTVSLVTPAPKASKPAPKRTGKKRG